jgi:hypothetical protein
MRGNSGATGTLSSVAGIVVAAVRDKTLETSFPGAFVIGRPNGFIAIAAPAGIE